MGRVLPFEVGVVVGWLVVLVLDRGYPAAWQLALLIPRGIRFVMRCDNDSGWAAGQSLLRSGLHEAWVTVNPPSADAARDWGCPAQALRLRLVRQIAPIGALRMLATNLDFTSRKCNRSCAAGPMQRLLPQLLLFIGDVCTAITEVNRAARRCFPAIRPRSISTSSTASRQASSVVRI